MELHSSAANSQNVAVAWKASSGTNVAGYNLYYGTVSRDYRWKITAGKTTNTVAPALVTGGTYFFAVTTYDSSGHESIFSNEAVFFVIPSAATLAKAAYSGGQFGFTVSGVAGYQYVVQASTNLTAWSSVETNISPFAFIDANATKNKRRFYRAVHF